MLTLELCIAAGLMAAEYHWIALWPAWQGQYSLTYRVIKVIYFFFHLVFKNFAEKLK